MSRYPEYGRLKQTPFRILVEQGIKKQKILKFRVKVY